MAFPFSMLKNELFFRAFGSWVTESMEKLVSSPMRTTSSPWSRIRQRAPERYVKAVVLVERVPGFSDVGLPGGPMDHDHPALKPVDHPHLT